MSHGLMPTLAFSTRVLFNPRPSDRADELCRRQTSVVVAAKPKKNKKSSVSGKGFGRTPTNEKSNTVSDETDANEDAPVEDTSIGEQTKKTELAGQQKMENPLDKLFAKTAEQDAAKRELDKIKPIKLSESEKSDMRWALGISEDEILENLVKAYDEDCLIGVVTANRHFLGEAFFYRMSSIILKTEGDGDQRTSAKLREIRTTCLRLGWEFDRPLKNMMKEKERKIAEAIRGTNVVSDIKRGQGSSQREKDVFWLVLFSAVAAWEAANESTQSPVRGDVVERLTAATDTIRENMDECSDSIRALDRILTAKTVEEQQSGVANVDEDAIIVWCEFITCLERCPPASYKAMLRKIVSIRDFVLSKNFVKRSYGIDPVRIEVTDSQSNSVLLQTYPGNVEGTSDSLFTILK